VTLVLTAANSRFVVQVSDRRLSHPTSGETYDDEANKAVVLVCQTAKLAIAYTGLGRIGRLRTDEWLVEVLTDAKAGQKNMREVTELLSEVATRTFSGLAVPAARKRHAFVLAGWYCIGPNALSPIIWLISNYHGKNWETLQEVMPAFEARFARPRRGTDPRILSAFFVHGRQDAFAAACGRRVKKLIKVLRRREPQEIVAKLVSLVRATAQHPLGRAWVGRSCMSIVIRGDLDSVAQYHPAAGPTGEIFGPHLVGPMLSFMHPAIWLGEGEVPSWWDTPPPLHR
jgi:hypothetical protein